MIGISPMRIFIYLFAEDLPAVTLIMRMMMMVTMTSSSPTSHLLCPFASLLHLLPPSSSRHLDLSNNSLTTLPRETLTTAPLLETLVLQANPWSCDCRLGWFIRWSLAHPGEHRYTDVTPRDRVRERERWTTERGGNRNRKLTQMNGSESELLA